jgi:hypothetical protein
MLIFLTYNISMMKNSIRFGMMMLIIFLSGCNEHDQDITTRINADGTCYRELTAYAADSAFMVGDTSKNPFPVKLDSTWKISWAYGHIDSMQTYHFSTKWPLQSWEQKKDTSKKNILVVKAKRRFSSVLEMSKTSCFSNSDWKDITPRVTLVKKFKWFFTLYQYRETLPKYNYFKRVPVDKYLSKEEITNLFSDNPKFDPSLNGLEIKEKLDDMNNRIEQWYKKNMLEEEYQIILRHLTELKNLKVDTGRLYQAKDSVFSLIKEDKESDNVLIQAMDKYFKTNAFSIYSNTSESVKKEMKLLEDKLAGPFSKTTAYHLIMPGKVIETSSKQPHGDTLNWKVDGNRFFFNDYEMYAESRVVNIWAFIVSGIFVLAVIISFTIKRR